MRALILPFLLLTCFTAKASSRNISSVYTANQIFISHPSDSNKKVEFYIDSHIAKEKLKTVIFIHGHQFPKKPGGHDAVKWGVLDK